MTVRDMIEILSLLPQDLPMDREAITSNGDVSRIDVDLKHMIEKIDEIQTIDVRVTCKKYAKMQTGS